MSDPTELTVPSRVETDVGAVFLLDLSDAVGGNQVKSAPPRSLAALRLLVRERMKVYGAPLPDGYKLPPGVTLDDLLGPAPGA